MKKDYEIEFLDLFTGELGYTIFNGELDEAIEALLNDGKKFIREIE